MDKKSITGLVLIGAILIGWLLLNQPSAEEIALRKEQHITDSIAQYTTDKKIKEQTVPAASKTSTIAGIPVSALRDSTGKVSDSVKSIILKQVYGDFANASSGENKIITIENEVMKVNISPRGGRIASVELKKYKTFDQQPLMLFNADSSTQNLKFTAFSKEFTTDSLYFTPEGGAFSIQGTDNKSISMRLYAGDKSKYIEYVYSLTGNEYMMGFRINVANMQDIITGKGNLTMNWGMKIPMQEYNHVNQQMASTIYYKCQDENVDRISESTYEKKPLEFPVKWIGFKQQFFTSAIIADNTLFDKTSEIETISQATSSKYVKEYAATINIPVTGFKSESIGMRMYFGPNHFATLKKYDLELEKQINLGWKIFGWLNRFLTIPIFNFLDSFDLNYGIIILILTIILKLLLLPIAYKTILSSAKMRVLKPEIDELNEKHKNDDPVKKQQATMALYKSAGVNPMAGCIPVLLQMPILIALFNFFPASIELRQQSFLWAHDLSTFDSVYNFGFNVPWYGDHVSLFALLMTGSTLLYTWSNSQLMGTSNQMPGMKWMMYLMPILFLGFMNSYSAGLSWYYFLANMITFGQTWAIQKFVIDHDALHAKIQENKKKPVKQSKFQQRLEQMTKERQQLPAKKK
ncbi:MAG: membrane protein insertase YidC [Bacteroidetes bacterium]|nr:membrane protein insertase YidC [Bacteroidota bacterium]